MEYTIIAGTEPYLLINEVRERIKDGWTPQGGVAAYMERNQQMFAQALVKDVIVISPEDAENPKRISKAQWKKLGR